ncbi:RNA-binding domain-containing protein [Ceraceosorus guamensis]|uniref:RNA-binding domain-containing protein n=1 Tax=Ceraceosorus guamensis TaxID=1522189 RepID=A0A316W6S0_9BASI|nr:RNA-binding domain-containing protein [Ceraceosorus guamensis]PWN45636.1 RNA-binding domain-containing protein [Ceraceosorus guamensis]
MSAEVEMATGADVDVPQAVGVEKTDEAASNPLAANRTIFISNLNQKIKLDVLKESLKGLFSSYGDVLSVTAHKNVRMKGQAFVAFADSQAAEKAVGEVKGFPLYGMPMQLEFAKTRSDEVVKQDVGGEGTEAFEEHKRQRLEHKKRQRRGNAMRRKELAKKIAAKRGEAVDTNAAQPAKRQEVQMPDEYLPPNKILFLQNVPSSVSRDNLEVLFQPFAGFTDVRLIPGRPVAFAEFIDPNAASIARDALNGHTFENGDKLKVTFAR